MIQLYSSSKFVKNILFGLVFLVNFSVRAEALRCVSLFEISSSTQAARYEVKTETLPNPAQGSLEIAPRFTRSWAAFELRKKFRLISIDTQKEDVLLAINLSPKNFMHIVSKDLTSEEHNHLINFIKKEQIDSLLMNVSPWVRNKYFEIRIPKYGDVEVKEKFAWELQIQTESQLLSGFALHDSDKIRKFDTSRKKNDDFVRNDLLSQKRSQESLCTCGISSAVQIINAHGIKVTEKEIVDVMEKLKIKTVDELYGSNPGLELNQLFQIVSELGKIHGFTAEIHSGRTLDDVAQFIQDVKEFASSNMDIILNYSSPVIGRPGAGHYSPVGGYNASTNEVLLSETSLTANPPFWIQAKHLVEAMAPDPMQKTARGYIVIRWH